MQRVFARAAGAAVLLLMGSPAIASVPHIYFADTSVIRHVRADGSGLSDVLLGSRPTELRVDEAGSRLFFVNGTSANNWLSSTGINGGAVQNILQAPAGSFINIAYDPVLDRVYGGDPNNDHIVGVNPNGSGAQTIVSTPNNNGFEVNVSTGQVYYTERFGSRIARVESNGSGNTAILTTSLTPGMVDAWTIDVDVGSNHMFFAGRLDSDGSHHIQRANLDGTGLTDVLTLAGVPRALRLDVDNGKMYWSENNLIRRANLDGTMLETVFTHSSTVWGLDVTPIPSPGTAALLVGVLLGARRRRA